MGNFVYLFSIIYIIVLIYLLITAKKRGENYIKVKMSLSILFVLTSVATYLLGSRNDSKRFTFLFLALLFCLIGDFFLGKVDFDIFSNTKCFKYGVVSFSIAHIFFSVMFYLFIGFELTNFILPIILMFVVHFLEKFDLIEVRELKFIITIYAAIIGIMATMAIKVALYGNLQSTYGMLTKIGAILFLLSDLILAFLYFGKMKNKEKLRVFNLSTYYLGCYILALTAFYL